MEWFCADYSVWYVVKGMLAPASHHTKHGGDLGDQSPVKVAHPGADFVTDQRHPFRAGETQKTWFLNYPTFIAGPFELFDPSSCSKNHDYLCLPVHLVVRGLGSYPRPQARSR